MEVLFRGLNRREEKRMLLHTGRPRATARERTRSAAVPPASPRFALAALVLVVGGMLGLLELQTSWLQSRLFSAWARSLHFSVEPGPAPEFRHPHSGPYDLRLGHSALSDHIDRLRETGFAIESQGRVSPALGALLDRGLFPIYDEKTATGLHIMDRHGAFLHRAAHPERIYPDFESVPPVTVASLLFIENREALESEHPFKNPAIEWNRLASAAFGYSLSHVGLQTGIAGGSTLATQLEKMRHSPGGQTSDPAEKLRQMISASLRVYSGGRETAAARRKIIVDYLNSIPLAAAPGYGEVLGLGDGLWAWFGADFDEVNRRLAAGPGENIQEFAETYRQVLSLLLAIKKPTAFLAHHREDLDARVNGYLKLLAAAGVIPPEVRDAALRSRLRFQGKVAAGARSAFAERKATDGVRVELLKTLRLNSVYELDRLDLSVESTLDAAAQRRVFEFLDQIRDPEFAGRAQLKQHRLLALGDPAGVIYSVTAYERGEGANYLRIQADNLDQPLNISEGTKLELGSTAKLRTLISYLNAITELHTRLSAMTPEERAAVVTAPEDRLTRWALRYFELAGETTLETMIEAAIQRRYSASPAASFFTGGGLHRFSNFDAKDNNRSVSVREALRRSVNLTFIRLMRDLVNYRAYRLPGVDPDLLANPGHPARPEYLSRFAEREGRQFLTAYFQKYQGLKTDEALTKLASETRKTPRRLAAIYRSVRPSDSVNLFAAYIIGNMLDPNLSDQLIDSLYDEFAPGAYGLVDRAYIAGVHPLELWLLQYKAEHPAAELGEIFRASRPYCQISYNWLFKSRARKAQDRAIRIMLEVDAFRALHAEWSKLGYPFRWLVPSLATALGSSGDTPAALADLIGILVNDGVHYPGIRMQRVHLAQDTPFETNLVHQPAPGERVMPAAVARLVRGELIGVVEHGTAVRARNSLRLDDGAVVPVGGKTGTGDNRYEMYGPGGKVIASRVINRTATFVFLIDDRFFGTVTAFVPGEAAAEYGFTSSLPVQIFRELTPVFAAMLEERTPPDLAAAVGSRPLPKPPEPREPVNHEMPLEPATAVESPQTSPSTPPQTGDSLNT